MTRNGFSFDKKGFCEIDQQVQEFVEDGFLADGLAFPCLIWKDNGFHAVPLKEVRANDGEEVFAEAESKSTQDFYLVVFLIASYGLGADELVAFSMNRKKRTYGEGHWLCERRPNRISGFMPVEK